MCNNSKPSVYVWAPVLLFWLAPFLLFAFEVTTFPDVPVKSDILLTPAKAEMILSPGAKSSRHVTVLNRTGQEIKFSVDVEDFASPTDSDGSVILDREIDGLSSSLKRYISVDTSSFVLSHGQQASLLVTVNLPKDVSSGGLYSAVLVSGVPSKDLIGATRIVNRLGALFFVKVPGRINELGVLKAASLRDKKVDLVFENSGDIYLNPYGVVEIYGESSRRLVKKVVVDPWFVMPRSSRIRTVPIDDLPPGKYFANLLLNRGYGDILDSKQLYFDIKSPKASFLTLGALVLIFLSAIFYNYLFYGKRKF